LSANATSWRSTKVGDTRVSGQTVMKRVISVPSVALRCARRLAKLEIAILIF
jgi:hypothetical protein